MTHDEALTIFNDFLNSPERSENCFNLHQFRGGVVAIYSCPKYVSEVDSGFLVLGNDEKGVSQWFDDEKIRAAWMDACELLASEDFAELNEEHMAFLDVFGVLENWDQALDAHKNPEHLKRNFPALYTTVDEAVIKMYHLAQMLEEYFVRSETESETFVRESAKLVVMILVLAAVVKNTKSVV